MKLLSIFVCMTKVQRVDSYPIQSKEAKVVIGEFKQPCKKLKKCVGRKGDNHAFVVEGGGLILAGGRASQIQNRQAG